MTTAVKARDERRERYILLEAALLVMQNLGAAVGEPDGPLDLLPKDIGDNLGAELENANFRGLEELWEEFGDDELNTLEQRMTDVRMCLLTSQLAAAIVEAERRGGYMTALSQRFMSLAQERAADTAARVEAVDPKGYRKVLGPRTEAS